MPNIISAIAASIYAFIALYLLIDVESTLVFDRFFLEYVGLWHKDMEMNQSAWIIEVIRDITALGSLYVLLLVSLIFIGFLYISNQKRSAVILCTAYLLSLASSVLLKGIIERPRPDFISSAPAVFSTSFPSAHAIQSTAVFVTLSLLLARSQRRYSAKVYLYCCGLTISLLVGSSRVLLGVHWPTDVIAGWLFGVALALAMMLWAQLWIGNHEEMV